MNKKHAPKRNLNSKLWRAPIIINIIENNKETNSSSDKIEDKETIPIPDNNDNKINIEGEVIFKEMYQEMRRHRDYVHISSTWYTTFLIAIIGFLLNSNKYNYLYEIIRSNDRSIFKFIIFAIALCILLFSIFSVGYSQSRYDETKDFINKNFRSILPDPPRKTFTPRHVIYITQVLLFLTIGYLLLTM